MSGRFVWYPGARAALQSAYCTALDATAQDIVADVEARGVVPYAESARKRGHEAGRLSKSVGVQLAKSAYSGARIVWDTEYATSVYYHPDWWFSTVVHGNAKARWMDDYVDGARTEFVRKCFRNHLSALGVLSR